MYNYFLKSLLAKGVVDICSFCKAMYCRAKKVKRVIIAGSRYFNDYDVFRAKVELCLSRIREEYMLVILSGHCSGVDMMAEQYAMENGIEVEIHPAQWNKYGRSAGPRRNKVMVELADFAIAFPSGGNGTKSLIALAKEKGIPTKIFPVSP